MPADAGIRFGQYVLLRRIARGGMAEVFLAQQRGLEGFDRRVAVKRILPHLADSPDFVKMFLGEAKLAAQLSHPNIVHIYEFGKVAEDYFIAMEFVDGVHAGQLFKLGEQREGAGPPDRLPPTLVARIGADAAIALHHAHELRAPNGKPYGLVHRDVSPANIMVSFDGVVKLCDFGIAKAAAVGDQLTNPGQVKGKYAYMSPEQTVASPLDGRSDVFSLAIVLWELLTGRYIVSRGDTVAAMRAIRDGKLEPIARAAPDVPAPLAEAITRALEPKRDKRPSAADFAQALEAYLKQAPELATSMQLGAWVRARFTRESTGQLAAIAPATGLVGGGTAMSPGTVASPGTVVSPGTVIASGTQGPVTPPSLAGASRIVAPPEPAPGSDPGTEILDASDLDETAETLKKHHPAFRPNAPTVVGDPSRRAANEPTARNGELVGDDTVIVDAAPTEDPDAEGRETLERTGARMAPVPSGPVSVPTAIAPVVGVAGVPESGPRRIPDSGPGRVPDSGGRRRVDPDGRRRVTPLPTELVRLRRRKQAIAVAGLIGLAVVSFLIALAASGSHGTPPPADAAGTRGDAPLGSALAVAPPPPDAAPEIALDAADADAAPMPTTLLEVRTFPDGGTIKVDDQTRVAPAQFALEAGRHVVIAELAGFAPERRTVELERGEHQKLEIALRHKLPAHGERGGHGERVEHAVGRLTARTTPYSEVYEGARRLGETPFADLELPAGTHVLTFKNPSHPPVTKTVHIAAGKATKLNFNLP